MFLHEFTFDWWFALTAKYDDLEVDIFQQTGTFARFFSHELLIFSLHCIFEGSRASCEDLMVKEILETFSKSFWLRRVVRLVNLKEGLVNVLLKPENDSVGCEFVCISLYLPVAPSFIAFSPRRMLRSFWRSILLIRKFFDLRGEIFLPKKVFFCFGLTQRYFVLLKHAIKKICDVGGLLIVQFNLAQLIGQKLWNIFLGSGSAHAFEFFIGVNIFLVGGLELGQTLCSEMLLASFH